MASAGSGSCGSMSFKMPLFMRQSSFLDLACTMVAMYSFRPTPMIRTMSAACRQRSAER